MSSHQIAFKQSKDNATLDYMHNDSIHYSYMHCNVIYIIEVFLSNTRVLCIKIISFKHKAYTSVLFSYLSHILQCRLVATVSVYCKFHTELYKKLCPYVKNESISLQEMNVLLICSHYKNKP